MKKWKDQKDKHLYIRHYTEKCRSNNTKNRELVTCRKTHRNNSIIILRVLIIYCWELNWSSSDFRLDLLIVVTELIYYWYSSRWGLVSTILYNNHCSLCFMLVNILLTCGWKKHDRSISQLCVHKVNLTPQLYWSVCNHVWRDHVYEFTIIFWNFTVTSICLCAVSYFLDFVILFSSCQIYIAINTH